MPTANRPDLVLIHGWGNHSGIWQPLQPLLEPHFRLHLIDLPGYGRQREWTGAWSLDTMAHAIAEQVPDGAIWLGWSLGGLIALHAALLGLPIERLIVTGTSPCFCRQESWPHATDPQTLHDFARELKQRHRATLLRFLLLQAQGSERAKEEVRLLRETIFAYGEPSHEILAAGLSILLHDDLRPFLAEIPCPLLAIHGARDKLAPAAALPYWIPQLRAGSYRLIENAGHAPFLSHPQPFIDLMRQDLHR